MPLLHPEGITASGTPKPNICITISKHQAVYYMHVADYVYPVYSNRFFVSHSIIYKYIYYIFYLK